MKYRILLTAFLFSAFNSFAQTDSIKIKEVVPPPPPPIATDKFIKVDIEASVDRQLWREHLSNSLGPILDSAVARGIPPGTYTVQVKFLIEKDGSISDVSALNDPGFGLAQGAVAVVKTGPRWTPGIQNKQKVRSYRTQPIIYVFSDK